MFFSKQFGFGSERITIEALAEITEQIRQGNTDTVRCVSLVSRKAFESVFHEILLAELENYGVRKNFSKRLKSY